MNSERQGAKGGMHMKLSKVKCGNESLGDSLAGRTQDVEILMSMIYIEIVLRAY